MSVDYNKHIIEVTCKKPAYWFVYSFYGDKNDYKDFITHIFEKIQTDGKGVTVYERSVDEDDAKEWLNVDEEEDEEDE